MASETSSGAAPAPAEALVAQMIALRRRLGVSQLDIALSMGVSQSVVSNFERHVKDPRLSTLRRYGEALGVDVEYSLHARR